MTDGIEGIEFHFLNRDPGMTGSEFLKKQLSFMLDHFSYEKLSGLSIDGLSEKIIYYNSLRDHLYNRFTNPDSIWADPEFAACVTDGEYDLYEPLTENQRMEIIRVCDQISGNFDKAREDTQDRKAARIAPSSVRF